MRFIAVACLTLTACTCDVQGLDASFACASDSDCSEGFACIAGICSVPGHNDGGPPPDAGLPDAGAPDAGTPDAGQPDAGPLDAGPQDAGDPCGSTVVNPDVGLVPIYCALHRTLTIDGDLSDWAGVPFTRLNRGTAASVLGTDPWPSDVDGGSDDADLSGIFALQWDTQFLYVAGVLTDDARGVHPTSMAYYRDDCFQIYIDGDHDRSGPYDSNDLDFLIRADNAPDQFFLGPGVDVFEAPDGSVSATTDTGMSASWAIEVAIPWSRLGPQAASPGRVIGFDLILDDDDDPVNQVRRHYLIWAQNDAGTTCVEPYCSTASLGDAVLTGAP